MAAAIAAAQEGVAPLVLDENARAGGQIYRQPPPALAGATPAHTAMTRRGTALLRRFHELQDRLSLQTETAVWGLFPPRRLAVSHAGSWDMIEAAQLLLAPGAYEYVPPFPGWTLPGVMTPGGAQNLVKTMHVLPGKRALVAGSGPFLLQVAENLHQAGMKVVGVVEAASTGAWLRAFPRLLTDLGLLRDGLGYLLRLRRAGIPLYRGHIVTEAQGDQTLRQVTVRPCDADWRPRGGAPWTVEIDTLCVGYGFVPRIQLAQLAGCRLRYAEELGGWVPEVDEDLQTTVAGIAVAGDGGGVGGALVAEAEGTLAGLAAAHRLGALAGKDFLRARRPVLRRLRRLRYVRTALDRVSRIRLGLNDLARADTVVCRCEEVTRAEVDTGFDFGGRDIRTLKVMTRLGMGPCQGCMCWPAAARWLATRAATSVAEIGPLSARPPIVPICIGDLAKGPTEEG
jgi:NADPH-dependent 2,4-dienoyl-CoA reductase/sulfur reductase-like enzyme